MLWAAGERDEARRVWREARVRDAANDVLRETLARLNPRMVFIYVSGVGADSKEQSRTMWERVRGRTENALAALRNLSSPRALVVRDGARLRIAGREVVCGDVLVLSEGDRIAADAVLLDGSEVMADESMLSGESVPVDKAPEGDAQLYGGTLLVRGQGMARERDLFVQQFQLLACFGQRAFALAQLLGADAEVGDEVAAMALALGQLALDHKLRRNSRVIRPRLPQRIVALHAAVTN